MDKTGLLAPTDQNGGPVSDPVGTSSRANMEVKQGVHGKDALKKIKEVNPALYEIISKAYVPEN